jgi:nucleotide-binding universal stress UspA family protein
MAEEAERMAVSLLRPEMIEVSLLTVVGTPQRETTVAREILHSTASDLSDRGVAVSTTVLEGEAANQIAELAAEGGYDLIVMSTHGHDMLTRTLVGSVTDRVVRTSEVPVLVIQPRSMEVPHDPVSSEDVDPENAA